MEKTKSSTALLLCVGLLSALRFEPAACERILAVAPIKARSHWNMMRGVLRALTNRGHHVTAFTPFPDGDRENYTEFDISDELQTIVRLDIGVVHELLTDHADLITFVHDYSRENCASVYSNDGLRRIMADAAAAAAPKFDVVVVEFMASECVSYLSSRLNVPLVYVTPPPLISYGDHMASGHIANPACVAHTLIGHSVPRTFAQRFANAVLSVYTAAMLQLKISASETADRRPFDATEPAKPSIVFSNAATFVTDAPRPVPPNVIQVGGIHLNPPERIPHDILEFVENSPNGVILFTLGSVVAVASLPEHVKGALLDVLGRVSQRVLLKYEDEMVNVPKNVMIKKWFPQRDILLHPNVKLFISHGGISGVYEAVDAGVPVLGFPVFYDQSRNLANLVDAGMAISMDLLSVSKDNFSSAISKLLNDEKYMKNAKIASERFKDRPMTPEQAVDYWIRYVVRHKGAPHLKSHTLNLPLYQYLFLDVLAVLLIIISLVVLVMYVVLKFTYKYCNRIFSSKKKSKSE